MNVWRLVVREISHSKLNFFQGLLSVTVAVASLVGAMTLLEAYELRTEELLSTKEDEVRKAGKEYKDAARKITKGLGFNILILPKDQDRHELFTEGNLSKTMQEEYVDKLANSKIVVINHLLPMVMKKIRWEEMDQSIILIGTRGEVPLAHRGLKKPLQDQVPKGTMVVGYEIHKKNKFEKDQKVTLMGREFTIKELHPQRGSIDDSTVWINLAEAQQMLGMQNLVNAIYALECNCASKDRVGQIRKEIAGILPGTQVIEHETVALARAETRNKAKQFAETELQREKDHRQQMLEQREGLAAVLVPLVIISAALWIGVLAFSNVRQRRVEIGILRAIGVRSMQILSIFLGKALLIGILGAAVGCLVGFGVGAMLGEEEVRSLFSIQSLLPAFVMAPLLSALASWIPAMLAARQDPALILQEA